MLCHTYGGAFRSHRVVLFLLMLDLLTNNTVTRTHRNPHKYILRADSGLRASKLAIGTTLRHQRVDLRMGGQSFAIVPSDQFLESR